MNLRTGATRKVLVWNESATVISLGAVLAQKQIDSLAISDVIYVELAMDNKAWELKMRCNGGRLIGNDTVSNYLLYSPLFRIQLL